VIRISKIALAPCFALLVLTGCSPESSAAAGPVAATVDGQEITVAALKAEMSAADLINANDPKVQRAALQRLIIRRLLAKDAQEQKLDQTPDAKVLRAAAAETVDANISQRAVLAKIVPPTRAEAEAYVRAHPEMFAQRTVYLLDQFQMAQNPDAALGKALEPANSLEQVEAILKARNINFQRRVQEVDSLRLGPQVSAQVAKLPPGGLFVLPGPAGAVINRVTASKPEPLVGERAATIATQVLLEDRRREAIAKHVGALITANKGKITYGEGFSPSS
jgi:EpsD family peptidyl-prolyl cis-trans isomerase